MAFFPDGYSTVISFSGFSGGPPLTFREKEVQPPGIEMGEIDTTTMRNGAWRTKFPKSLGTLTEVMCQVQYDPATIYSVLAFGAIGTITVGFPDGSALSFQGWVDSFKPSSNKEGEFPLAEIKVIPSLQTRLQQRTPAAPFTAIVNPTINGGFFTP